MQTKAKKQLTTEAKIDLIQSMCAIQDDLNTETSGDSWRISDTLYLRAAWIEAAELMDHIGWKWWKKQELDLPQAQMEVVDILHFLLSWSMQWDMPVDDIVKLYNNREGNKKESEEGLLEDVEQLALDILTGVSGRDIWFMFFCVAKGLGMDLEDLYTLYLKKNTLNHFRQNNGYKEGTYVKNWDGVEDNVFLANIDIDLSQYLWNLDEPTEEPLEEQIMDDVYQELVAKYQEVAYSPDYTEEVMIEYQI